MALYRIADFLWDIEARYDTVPRACASYRVEDGKADFVIRVTEEMLMEEHQKMPENSLSYTENICVCRAVCNTASAHGAILLHAATVMAGCKAYAFSAPSGTGKSTHIRLWKSVYGDAVTILNGDKPLLREKDGELIAYGTPWCGKEGWNTNAKAPLAGLCFLERGEENKIRRLSPSEAVDRVFRQMLKPKDARGVAETLRLADLMIRKIPVFLLSCNISEEAARLSYGSLTEKKG